MEFDSGDNLYECMTYDLGCDGASAGYPDLFYGTATHSLPESCHSAHPCESAPGKKAKAISQGNGQMFTKKADARTWLNKYYSGGNANRPVRYYVVTVNSTTYKVVLIKAHAPNGNAGHPRKHYFGVETLPLTDATPDSTFRASGERHGKALFFDFNDNSDPNDNQVLRRATVWLM
jgi:hypothetical protein